MLTSADIKKLLEVFATKDDIKQLVNKKEFSQLVDGVYGKLDAVYGEVKDMRQEQKMHQAQHDRVGGRLDNLEERVDILEQA